jgi:hypothetical protein
MPFPFPRTTPVTIHSHFGPTPGAPSTLTISPSPVVASPASLVRMNRTLDGSSTNAASLLVIHAWIATSASGAPAGRGWIFRLGADVVVRSGS